MKWTLFEVCYGISACIVWCISIFGFGMHRMKIEDELVWFCIALYGMTLAIYFRIGNRDKHV